MKGIFNENRAFGVEIEFSRPNNVSQEAIAMQLSMIDIRTHVEDYNHATREWWKIVYDSSVEASRPVNNIAQRGKNEIVSPLLFGKNGLEQIEKVCTTLQSLGCTVNYSCGLHVHHDVREQITNVSNKLAEANIEKLVKWVAKFEHCIYKLIAPSRLDERKYSIPVRKRYELDANENGRSMPLYHMARGEHGNPNSAVRKTVKNIVKNKSFDGAVRRLQRARACGLNLFHIFGRGSVEFRYHQGSLNATKIQNWVILTQMILSAVESKRSVTLKHVEGGTVGMAKFRKALGLGVVRSEFNAQVNEYVKKTYKKFSKRESDYERHYDYRFVREGI